MNKMRLLFTLIVIIIGILLFPNKFYIKDGGSYGYEAVLYKITFQKAGKDLYLDAERGIALHVFPCFDLFWSTE